MPDYKKIADYFFEAGALKYKKRSGWWVAGIDNPESIAEHSHRTALIAFVLAKLEGADADKAAAMSVFHDLPEARITDLHKVAQHYIDSTEAEDLAARHQSEQLPESVGAGLLAMFREFNAQKTAEAIIAKDADLLEVALQGKEYFDNGCKKCREWFERAGKELKTESAKKIFKEAMKSDGVWWKGLKAKIR